MPKRTKPDAAERVAATVYPLASKWSTGEEDAWNARCRKTLASRIRRALRDARREAVTAEQIRIAREVGLNDEERNQVLAAIQKKRKPCKADWPKKTKAPARGGKATP